MKQALKTSLKPSQRALFLRERLCFTPKKHKKPSKTPPAVDYRGIFRQKKYAVKEPDPETGLYYYGSRYLDPKTSRWISGDPALGEYLPSAGRKANDLPGMGGVYNTVNLHTYHYAGNNPVGYVDPDGRMHDEYNVEKQVEALETEPIPNESQLPGGLREKLKDQGWIDITTDQDAKNDAALDLKEKVFDENTRNSWDVTVTPVVEEDTIVRPRTSSEGGDMRGENKMLLPGIGERTRYEGRIFRVYPSPSDPRSRPYKEYYDVDGNGRIDFRR